MIKKIMGLSLLAVALIFSQGALAHEGGHDFCVMKVFKQLDLTDDQKAKLKQMKTDFRTSFMGKFKELHALREQTNVLIQSEKLDEAKLDVLIKKRTELLGQLMKSKAVLRNQLYNFLDAKQKAKFVELRNKCIKQKIEQFRSERDDY